MVIPIILLSLAQARLYTSNNHPNFGTKPIYGKQPRDEACDVTVAGVAGCSGMIDIGSNGSEMFYWMTYAEGQDINAMNNTTPVIMWLQGGPGCSSMTGLFFELGPLRVASDCVPYKAALSWNKYYHLLFVDNPIGAGYSFAGAKEDYVTSYT